jgi:putative tryptophan/tyrosine transport system substrate-binding protein
MRWLSACAVAVLAALLGAGVAADAQSAPGKTPHVGLLSIGTDPARPGPQWTAFLGGLRTLGYVEGQNIAIERRFAAGNEQRVTEFAAELVQRQVNVIVVTGTREIMAARRATTTIPIVTIVAPDLVAAGIVTSLARPGGNITGLTFSASGVGGKYVELLHEAVPSATRVSILASRPSAPELQREMNDAARALNVTIAPLEPVKEPGAFEAFFARAKRQGAGGLIVPIDGLTVLHRQAVVDLAAKYRLPAIYTQREHVEIGGLMAYGASFLDLFQRAPIFVDKILKGARPAELPMEQPTKFEFVINAKTAKALGLSLPQGLLLRADQVLE